MPRGGKKHKKKDKDYPGDKVIFSSGSLTSLDSIDKISESKNKKEKTKTIAPIIPEITPQTKDTKPVAVISKMANSSVSIRSTKTGVNGSYPSSVKEALSFVNTLSPADIERQITELVNRNIFESGEGTICGLKIESVICYFEF